MKSSKFLTSFILIFTSTIPIVWTHWDPYNILGVKQDATFEQVKQAYRSLAKKLHPDKHTFSEDNRKFIEIQKAFEYIKVSRSKDYVPQGTTERIISRCVDYVVKLFQFITALETTSLIVLTFICAVVLMLISYHSRSILSRFLDTYGKPKPINRKSATEHQENNNSFEGMKIIELKLETYNGMVRLLKPGHRTIILLCDQKSKPRLLREFKKSVWPYRRNKALLFGYLCLDKNLEWYRMILVEVLGLDLNLNKKNCIGTVLSLNGFKKYFRLYHAKHKESSHGEESDSESFLGFDDYRDRENTSIEECLSNGYTTSAPCCTDDLLVGLSSWLEKVFEGSTKRYYLDEWPECMN